TLYYISQLYNIHMNNTSIEAYFPILFMIITYIVGELINKAPIPIGSTKHNKWSNTIFLVLNHNRLFFRVGEKNMFYLLLIITQLPIYQVAIQIYNTNGNFREANNFLRYNGGLNYMLVHLECPIQYQYQYQWINTRLSIGIDN
ncbi:hypothetical protein ACJX0J_040864, partial [Zea mays]